MAKSYNARCASGSNAPKTLKDHPFYGFELDEEQAAFRDAIWNPEKLIVFCNAKAGTGKAQPKNTLIPTPSGEKLLGDIQVGDFVFDRRGQPTKVLGVFEQGQQRAYRVSFNDGRSTICAGEHLWTYYGYRENVVTETLNSMMQRSVITGNRGARYNIPINNAVQYSTKHFEIDPYVIGAFLGDGCCTCDSLTLSSADEELVSEVAELMSCTYKKNTDKNYSWTFYNNGHRVITKDFFSQYPSMINTCDKKRIPLEYFYGDVEQRKSLLQGLMDTDGGITFAESRYNVRYSSVNKELMEDILRVIYSLGYSGTINCDYRDQYENGVCYNLSMRIPNSDKADMFRLSRKKNMAMKAKVSDAQRKYDRLAIRDIEDLGYECEMVCIYVDNSEHLYLTNDFIVTHNTMVATATANLLVQYGRYEGIVYISSPTQESKLGFLPGEIEDKTAVYSEPFMEALMKINVNPYTAVNQYNITNQKNGTSYIDAITHVYLRGCNFENKVIIIDESQNFYIDELKKTLTRMSDNCKVIVIGHSGQIDLYHNPENSGFVRYLEHFKNDPRTAVCELHKNYRGWISSHADELT